MTSKEVLTGVFMLFVLAVLAGCSISLPQTGQTTCSDAAGTPIACTGTGQDGELQTGVAEPSPRFTLDGTGACVTDNLTGLMWTRNANLLAGVGGATDSGRRYWDEALAFAKGINFGLNPCGFTDWRLPNRKELRSLVNYSVANNAATLNTLGFNNVRPGNYWSSSSYAGSADSAWVVRMYDGYVYAYSKPNSYYVWPVRAGQFWPVRAGQ